MEFTMQLRKSSLKNKIKSTKIVRRRIYNKKKKEKNCQKIDRCVCTPLQSSSFEFPRIWKELRLNSQLVDGVVRCSDNKEFKIHRAILSAASSYFRALFTNSINRCRSETYEANVNVPSEVFELLLEYAYTGICPINQANVRSLLKYADQYEILGVVQKCCSFLLSELNPKNCFSVLAFANRYFCRDLVKKGRRFVTSNFTKILKESKQFVHIDVEQLIDILKDDELNVKSEEIVFEAITKWINFFVKVRGSNLLELLKCIRFGNLPCDSLRNITKHPLVQLREDCRDYMEDMTITIVKLMCTGEVDFSNIIFRPRISHDVLFAIGGWSAGSPTNFVETYDIRADRWLLSSDTDSIPRAYHGLCTLNGLIYVIGGFDGGQYFNTVRKFDPINHTWTECACMYCHRCYVSVVNYDNKIYAMGGYNGRIRLNSVERYDPERNQWEVMPSMQKQRSDASAAALNGKIYIVGGFSGQEVMKSGEVFDIKENQWSYIPQMISPRSGVSLVVYDNALYALGGFNGYIRLKTGEKYVPGFTTWWTEISDMMTPRSNFATVILDDYIYVIGGFNGSSTINIVEYYDPETDEWFEASSMNLNRSALSAGVISNLPNIREYSVMARSQEERGQGGEICRD